MTCYWFTGLPCSGKTAIATELSKHFINAKLLDGDFLRNTPLSNDIGFSIKDRKKHINRIGYVAKMLLDNGVVPICSFISPHDDVRNNVRDLFSENEFFLIHVATPLSECEKRDVKGMYAKARAGIIKDFTGIDAVYEEPKNANLTIDTTGKSPKDFINLILEKSGRNAERKRSCHIFIGRWNGVFHNGHMHIINKKLQESDKNILLLIRDVEPDENNPYTAIQVKEMIDFIFRKNNRVFSIIIPDVDSVEYGRGVGYEVNEIKVNNSIAGISGTKIREQIRTGSDDWKNFVPLEMVEYLKGNQCIY